MNDNKIIRKIILLSILLIIICYIIYLLTPIKKNIINIKEKFNNSIVDTIDYYEEYEELYTIGFKNSIALTQNQFLRFFDVYKGVDISKHPFYGLSKPYIKKLYGISQETVFVKLIEHFNYIRKNSTNNDNNIILLWQYIGFNDSIIGQERHQINYLTKGMFKAMEEDSKNNNKPDTYFFNLNNWPNNILAKDILKYETGLGELIIPSLTTSPDSTTTSPDPTTTSPDPTTTTPPVQGKWRVGKIGNRDLRKLGELFSGVYPTEDALNKCINRASERGYKYISANSQGGQPSCKFYNDDGITDKSSITKGEIINDLESVDPSTNLYYVMPENSESFQNKININEIPNLLTSPYTPKFIEENESIIDPDGNEIILYNINYVKYPSNSCNSHNLFFNNKNLAYWLNLILQDDNLFYTEITRNNSFQLQDDMKKLLKCKDFKNNLSLRNRNAIRCIVNDDPNLDKIILSENINNYQINLRLRDLVCNTNVFGDDNDLDTYFENITGSINEKEIINLKKQYIGGSDGKTLLNLPQKILNEIIKLETESSKKYVTERVKNKLIDLSRTSKDKEQTSLPDVIIKLNYNQMNLK